ncbi:MAG: xanthine dehydrogenase accessory protein XdhC [Pseudomonadota bacterium]
MSTRQAFLAALDVQTPLARVTVIKAEGSTPREAGADMLITASDFVGTIGGGTLEFDVIDAARKLLTETEEIAWLRQVRDYPLGPSLNQCCGGFVSVLVERFTPTERERVGQSVTGLNRLARPVISGTEPIRVGMDIAAPDHVISKFDTADFAAIKDQDETWIIDRQLQPDFALYLYGAGHVGRQLVRILADANVEIVWIDIDAKRFPEAIPPNAQRVPAQEPWRMAAHAPEDAYHLVMTHSHALDLDICNAVLQRGAFGFLGLIGSKTKKARMVKRLRALGVAEDSLGRMVCPIGIDGITGKDPAIIAVSTAAQLMQVASKPA